MDQVRKLDGFDNFILPSPKIPENNDIKPSGHNYTRPTEAVFINAIPPGVDILQKSSKNTLCHKKLATIPPIHRIFGIKRI